MSCCVSCLLWMSNEGVRSLPTFTTSPSANTLFMPRVDSASTGVEMLDSLLTQKPFGIRALIVQGGDPAAVLSGSAKVQEALSNLDLLVVHDLFPTATGRLADFLLPSASFLERDLVLNYR